MGLMKQRPLAVLGRASRTAADAPPPHAGEVRRTALPDTFDGIRFEIARMSKYIQVAAKDPMVREAFRQICADAQSPEECLDRIDAWCRDHYMYLNDPPGIEYVQTTQRMLKQTRVPPQVLMAILEPFYDVMAEAFGPGAYEYEPAALCFGDCDEGCILYNGLCATADGREGMPVLRPILMRFGGNGGTLHHVWSKAGNGNGEARDSDITEPDYRLGDFSRFQHYEEVEVPV